MTKLAGGHGGQNLVRRKVGTQFGVTNIGMAKHGVCHQIGNHKLNPPPRPTTMKKESCCRPPGFARHSEVRNIGIPERKRRGMVQFGFIPSFPTEDQPVFAWDQTKLKWAEEQRNRFMQVHTGCKGTQA